MALAGLASLLVAILLLVAAGLQAARIDSLVVAGVLVVLLGMAWIGTRRRTEARP